MPEMQLGLPELVAGARGVDREVRWAHVAAGTGVAPLLDGGEFILTTGAGWPHRAEVLATVAEEFVTAGGDGVAAIALELGRNFDAAPEPLITACEAHGVPLIALHREVRFVQITQRVHQRILAAQTEALKARADVHQMLTELGLNRSPVDYVVEQLALELHAPVVLEDSARRVIAWADAQTSVTTGGSLAGGPTVSTTHRAQVSAANGTSAVPAGATDITAAGSAGGTAGHPLAEWAGAAGRGFATPRDWERVSVEARGTRWGWLTALPGPPHAAGRRTVLELGAFALALGRLADPDGEQWLELGTRELFAALLGGRYRSEADLETQLVAAGLPLAGREVFAATLTGQSNFGGDGPLQRVTLETALRRAVAPTGNVILTTDGVPAGSLGEDSMQAPNTAHTGAKHGTAPRLIALVSLPTAAPAAPHHREEAHADPPTALATRLARELDMLVPDTTPPSWRAHLSLGEVSAGAGQLAASLEQLREVGVLPESHEVGRVRLQRAEQRPLAFLVRGLAGSPELQRFADAMLGPLEHYDREHRGDLVRVLAAYTAHPTNRSLAAQRARLSRSVFYQRIALIESLLGVDLGDGETLAALTVALLTRHTR